MEGGGEAGARVLRDGNVAELYGKFDEGRPAESDRSDDGDDDFVVDRIDRQDGEDRRIHRSRLSQSLTNPCETLISCSFRTRKDGRTSGECAQHLRITSYTSLKHALGRSSMIPRCTRSTTSVFFRRP